MTAAQDHKRFYDSIRNAGMADHEQPVPIDPAEQRVYDVIDDLGAGRVTPPIRGALRRALDQADAPVTGRARSDQAIGSMTGNKAHG